MFRSFSIHTYLQLLWKAFSMSIRRSSSNNSRPINTLMTNQRNENPLSQDSRCQNKGFKKAIERLTGFLLLLRINIVCSCQMEHGEGSITDYDMLVCEILSRLPAKSLMRFKCVCKRFRHLIQEDEYFIDLHYNRSKARLGLFIIMARYPRLSTSLFNGPWSLPATMDEKCFLLADIIECANQVTTTKAVIHTIRNTDANEFNYKLILGPVNGLICFVDWEVKNSYISISNFYIRIFNVSTREITPWMKSSFLREERGEHCGSREVTSNLFQLGFDPVTKETKLVGVWSIRKKHCNAYFVCEVLTLRSNTWRRIDNVPLYNIQSNSAYLNGSIYWRSNKPLFKEFDNAGAQS
ncbi:hypothetical protein C5167_025855 [Papaver somniferum]|uniref:F-box domain-containing protein n=1 Tax=Papaver somniferum TaxID=3469 RepID=A0A4Y7JWL3_PAPSO|nr:hypothetical protein C5167_025855 [Papaver somniferum]